MYTRKYKHKIAINGRFLVQPATGVQRYAVELIRAWDNMLDRGEIDPNYYQLEIVSPRLSRSIDEFIHIPIREIGLLKGNWWEQIELPWHVRGEFLFNPCNIGPVLKFNQAVTIHDASVFAVPLSYSFLFRIKYRLVFLILAKTAKIVFTVSEHSKMELQNYCHVPANKLHVVYEGGDHFQRIHPDISILQRNNIGSKPFILTVGSSAVHKNLSIMEEVSKRLPSDIDIVMAGEEFMSWFKPVSTRPKDGIKRLGYITDEELKALYQKATAFVFPSVYEGFGLPPLEAMTCGCPVICSRVASLEEICGEAVVYFNPDDPRDLAEKIQCLLDEESIQQQLKTKGIMHANKYKWTTTARLLWERLKSYLL